MLAGVIYENFKMNVRKTVWVTANNGLFASAKTEIAHFLPGADFLEVNDLPKLIRSQFAEVLLITYKTLTDATKYQKVKDWLGKNYEGLVCFGIEHVQYFDVEFFIFKIL